MIITSVIVGTDPVNVTMYDHTYCTCSKAIFRPVDGTDDWGWVHTDNESTFCYTQYVGLRDDYATNYSKATPLIGAVNRELMYSNY